MKRNIEHEIKTVKKLGIFIIGIAVLFALFGAILFFKKDILEIFPRMDIAWIGFVLVAFLFCVIGMLLFAKVKHKQDWISETDERETLIASEAFTLGYLVQTVLLSATFFLLTFMGYLNKVSGFSIVGILALSEIVLMAYHGYLRKVK